MPLPLIAIRSGKTGTRLSVCGDITVACYSLIVQADEVTSICENTRTIGDSTVWVTDTNRSYTLIPGVLQDYLNGPSTRMYRTESGTGTGAYLFTTANSLNCSFYI